MHNELVSVAQRIIDGDEISDVDFASFHRSNFEKAEKSANKLWYYCRKYQDDADIRKRDQDYGKGQRETVAKYLKQYLGALGNVG